MIPNYNEMMWVVSETVFEIQESIVNAIDDNIKIEKAYLFAKENSWEKVKQTYYLLWKYKQ